MELGVHYASRTVLCVSVVGITSGPRLKICRQQMFFKPPGDLCLWERECWSIHSVSGFGCSLRLLHSLDVSCYVLVVVIFKHNIPTAVVN